MNEEIELALPIGVDEAKFGINGDSMVELAHEVERLLAECNHDDYTATFSGLRAVRQAWKPGEQAVWNHWSCTITLKRRR